MQSKLFHHQGYDLHYTTSGSPDNPPLLMVHGYCSSHHVWRTTIPELENDLFCVTIDLLGHGESPIDPDGDYSIAAQARRVLALADEMGFSRFHVIGHSMGGQIGLCLASTVAPDRVEKLVEVAGVVAAKLSDRVERQVFMPLKLMYHTPLGSPAESFYRLCNINMKLGAKAQFGLWFYDFDCVDFDWWRIDRRLANQVGMRHTWYHGMNAIHGLDLTPHLKNIKAPTLVIFGQQDAVVPITDGHLADEHIADSRLVLLDACGHFPMYEKQAEYLEAVREFLLLRDV